MKKQFTLIMLAAGIIGAAGIGVSGRSQQNGTPSPSPEIWAKPSVTPKIARDDASTRKTPTGYIEGSLVYPGEGVPRDIRVCAVNLLTFHERCTRKTVRHGRFKAGQGYRLSVQPGNYQVYAVVPSFDPGYQAFYSAFVTCGYEAGCTDHSPITISVRAGKTRTDIEPGDFYDN